MRPFIGISTRLIQDEPISAPICGIRITYLNAIEAAGGIPIPIALNDNLDVIKEVYKTVSAILLPGGEDVNPTRYGEAPHPKLGKVDDLRDEVEINLARWAFKDLKPTLAICRGIQVMNVALGGSLYQDLPSQGFAELTHASPEASEMWTHLAHEINIEPSSKLAKLLGENKIKVNSIHHQAIKQIAPTLRISAKSPDGVVEAAESETHPFFIGVQCHPETLYQNPNSPWLKLFAAFTGAGKSYRA